MTVAELIDALHMHLPGSPVMLVTNGGITDVTNVMPGRVSGTILLVGFAEQEITDTQGGM